MSSVAAPSPAPAAGLSSEPCFSACHSCLWRFHCSSPFHCLSPFLHGLPRLAARRLTVRLSKVLCCEARYRFPSLRAHSSLPSSASLVISFAPMPVHDYSGLPRSRMLFSCCSCPLSPLFFLSHLTPLSSPPLSLSLSLISHLSFLPHSHPQSPTLRLAPQQQAQRTTRPTLTPPPTPPLLQPRRPPPLQPPLPLVSSLRLSSLCTAHPPPSPLCPLAPLSLPLLRGSCPKSSILPRLAAASRMLSLSVCLLEGLTHSRYRRHLSGKPC